MLGELHYLISIDEIYLFKVRLGVIDSITSSTFSRLHVGSAEDPGEEWCCGFAGEPNDPLPNPVHPSHWTQAQH